ncbi:hypothetical protein [Marinicella sp. W31]|uniref:sialidase family protein n=1 Tax=Marinicella sp. W31 TaxID=3023713 RepID=UPI003757A486
MKKSIVLILVLCAFITAQAEIRQELGVDQRVNYADLTKYGPWDDRNYQVTLEDLAVIPANDQYLANVPVFFKVLARKDNPKIGEFYPRSLYQAFLIHYGGLMVDGIWYKEGIGRFYHPDTHPDGKPIKQRGALLDPDAEIPLSVLSEAGNETTIEFNPTNNNNAVAGINAAAGQTMYYSSDGGDTWTISQVNPTGSCCDPTVDWSSDGSLVYQAELFNCGFGGCGVRASVSSDQGVTWGPFFDIVDDGASDKEFIHVDRSPGSPYQDNIYITYHTGNVMQFAKSEDMGATWTTPVAFNTNGEDTGIGSDITTDSAGNVYYFYPGLNGSGINLLKSTDGGDTFGAPIQVSTIRGRFDFPIPAMESREVFIYVSVDVDSADNIYVAWTDETADSTGGANGTDPLTNRGEIRIAKSTDAGVTWTEMAKPHADDGFLADPDPIDRFHPWLMVAENDAVHIGFYDTRNSSNRTGVDFYYNVSTDGAVSWLPQGEQRYSTVTSENIANGQEWGDYNGLSVVLDKIAMTWTDNRANEQTAMAGPTTNAFGSPTYNLAADPNSISVCAGDVGATTQVTVSPVQGYAEDVTLSVSASPAFVSNESFSTNPVVGGMGTSDLTFDIGGGSPAGDYVLTIEGTGNEPPPPPAANRGGPVQIVRTTNLNITYSAAPANGTILAAPADGAMDVDFMPTFLWTLDINANNYLIEVSDAMDFSNIIASAEVDIPKFTFGDALPAGTTLYWRVTSQSGCGDVVSAVASFTTSTLPGQCDIGTPVAEVASYDFESGDQGWVTGSIQGVNTWALAGINVNSGVQSFHADNVAEVAQQTLESPDIAVPSGLDDVFLNFWHEPANEIDADDSECYDGGILEISTDGGTTYTQVTSFLDGDYFGPIDAGFSNPLAGLNAWCGGSAVVGSRVAVDLAPYAGQTIKLRYQLSSDTSVANPGWDVDDVEVFGCGKVDTDIIFADGFDG